MNQIQSTKTFCRVKIHKRFSFQNDLHLINKILWFVICWMQKRQIIYKIYKIQQKGFWQLARKDLTYLPFSLLSLHSDSDDEEMILAIAMMVFLFHPKIKYCLIWREMKVVWKMSLKKEQQYEGNLLVLVMIFQQFFLGFFKF